MDDNAIVDLNCFDVLLRLFKCSTLAFNFLDNGEFLALSLFECACFACLDEFKFNVDVFKLSFCCSIKKLFNRSRFNVSCIVFLRCICLDTNELFFCNV
jgi:hypothetical protein